MDKKTKNKLKKFLLTLVVVIVLTLINKYSYLIEGYGVVEKNEVQYKEVSTTLPNLEITFLDVGQADSALIRYQDTNILIDAGNNGDGKLLVDYFKSLGIEEFDYVVGTHSHEDHIGGMDDIINNFDITHYLMPDVKINTKTYQDVLDALENKDITQEVPKVDEKIEISDLTFDVLSIGNETDDPNINSIVLMLAYQNNKFLFMGDAPKEVELEILDKDLSCDVLKAGHHGSKYSSSAQFLVKARPTYAIISAGKDNKYGHPHQVTLDKLEYIKTKVYQTKDDGSIKVTSDGTNINIETFKTNTNSE